MEKLRSYLLGLTGLGCAGLIIVLVVVVALVLFFIVPEGTYIGAIRQDSNGNFTIFPTAETFARLFAGEGQFAFLVIAFFLLGCVTELRGLNDEVLLYCKALAVLVALVVSAGCIVAYLHFGWNGVESLLYRLWDTVRYLGIIVFCGGFAWWFGSGMGRPRGTGK